MNKIHRDCVNINIAFISSAKRSTVHINQGTSVGKSNQDMLLRHIKILLWPVARYGYRLLKYGLQPIIRKLIWRLKDRRHRLTKRLWRSKDLGK